MIYPDVFKDFQIQVKRYHKVHSTYICETDKGTRAVRIYNNTPAQIALQYEIKEHLIQNGFDELDRMYLSRKNTPYVSQYNKLYVMTDWHEGTDIDINYIEDIKEATIVLANMHIAGTDFMSKVNNKEIRIKNLGDTYTKRYNETKKLIRKINNTGNKTDFELLYLKAVPKYLELEELALNFTNSDSYQDLLNTALVKKTIIHNKYTHHNLIKTNKPSLIVTGFEKSEYNVQLIDLAYLIRRVMRKNDWDLEILSCIIETYSKVKPISVEEWEVLKGMIIFPEKFATLSNQYYHSRRRWNYNMFQRKLLSMLEYQDGQIECMKQIIEW